MPGNPTNQPIGCSAQLPGRNPWQHFCNRGKAALPPALVTCFTVITDLLTIWRSFSRTVRSFLGGGSWNVHRFQRHRFSEPNKVYRCEYLRRCRFSALSGHAIPILESRHLGSQGRGLEQFDLAARSETTTASFNSKADWAPPEKELTYQISGRFRGTWPERYRGEGFEKRPDAMLIGTSRAGPGRRLQKEGNT